MIMSNLCLMKPTHFFLIFIYVLKYCISSGGLFSGVIVVYDVSNDEGYHSNQSHNDPVTCVRWMENNSNSKLVFNISWWYIKKQTLNIKVYYNYPVKFRTDTLKYVHVSCLFRVNFINIGILMKCCFFNIFTFSY